MNGAAPASANLYPWDVDGDPAAASRIARLGLTGVTLAAAYHAVRAVTPFHPRHRVVTRDAAVYYRPDPARPAASFERAAAWLHTAGLPVTAWAVLTHNGRAGAAAPAVTVRNAFGDRYPWALCISAPQVLEYAATLAAEVAALPDAAAVELEACGWYGVEHGSAHDKTGGAVGGAAEWLLSVCFCGACRDRYRAAGADPAALAVAVRAALAPPPGGSPAAALPDDVAGLLRGVRAQVAASFQGEVIAAVRAAAPGKRIYLHAHPDPQAMGANPGCDPAVLLGPGGADGIVLWCWDPAEAAALVRRTVAAAPAGAEVAASLLAVEGLGGHPATLADQAGAVLDAGAAELRLYHAGLASQADLAAIRALGQGQRPED